jgi:hypothetical protein
VPEVLGRVVGLRQRPQRRHVDELGLVRVAACASSRLRCRVCSTCPLASVSPDASAVSRRDSSFSGSGSSCTRNRSGVRLATSVSAAATLAEDHELLDQPVGVEPVLEGHRQHLALGRQLDAPLGQVEVEGARTPAVPAQRLIGSVKRPQHRLQQRLGLLVGLARRWRPAPAHRRARPATASARA